MNPLRDGCQTCWLAVKSFSSSHPLSQGLPWRNPPPRPFAAQAGACERACRRATRWIVFFPWNQNRAVAGSHVAAIPARPVRKHGRRAVSQKARNAGIPFGRIGRIARWP